ncbi:signaling protein [Idiomarina seosinensis]|uniref:signaling protein n=1 Tax=Idiomarina seosinensis TaxID=281739 RepID=UPI00384DAB19
MQLKQRLLPIGIALLLVAMLFISWTPNWESAEFLRSTKPYVAFDYQLEPAGNGVLQDVVEDIDNRLEVRHEWHKVSDSEAQYRVSLLLQKNDQNIQLEASINKSGKSVDHIIVRGDAEVKHELSERLVKLLSDRIEAAHQTDQTAN